jgi:hypothetical protein
MNDYTIKANEFICNLHTSYNCSDVTPLSPCRFKCLHCKQKRIHGYTNPDHVCNPFGYLYLVPMYCVDCAILIKTCMWCK